MPVEREDQGSSRVKDQPGGQGARGGERPWRSLSHDEMNAVKLAALGGGKAARLWGDALNALHAFAQASECPPGYDLTRWFHARMVAYQDALDEAHYSPQPHDEPLAGDKSRDTP